jgi:hypothetical protein
MIKRALVVSVAVLLFACNSKPSQTSDNSVGGAYVVSNAPVPMTKQAASLSMDWGKKAQAGQVAIADVLTYGGNATKITAPAGWQAIRDDSTATTRQSLYWHAIQANDVSTSEWTFSNPSDAQGAIVVLDSVAADNPIDMSTGNTGTGGTLTAKSVSTIADGDLVLSFFATDFARPGLLGSNPQLPADTKTVLNQQEIPREYWILQTYQSQPGATAEQVMEAAQLFNWAAAQVAIKHASH